MTGADFERLTAAIAAKLAGANDGPGSSYPFIQAPTIAIGTVTTVDAGTPAAANIRGTSPNFILDLTLPEGPDGIVPSIGVGNVETLPSGDDATVTLDPAHGVNDYVFHFGIPRGNPGRDGIDGAPGPKGDPGGGVTVGTSCLICMASTGAKNNAEFNLFSQTYSRTKQNDGSRQVVFQCDRMDDAGKDRILKAAFANSLSLTAFLQILTIDNVSVPNRSVVTAVELFGNYDGVDDDRGDIVQGHINDGTAVCIDMQMNSNNQSWFARVNMRFNGALQAVNASVGSSNTQDWLNLPLRRYIASIPRSALGIGNYGIGNDVTEPFEDCNEILSNVDDSAVWQSGLVDELFILGEPGARLTDIFDDPDLIPAQTVEMTTLQVLHEYLRNFFTQRRQGITFISTEPKFLRPSTQGFTTTDDMTSGEPPKDFLQSSGPHWVPAGDDQVAEAISELLIDKVPVFDPFPVAKTDFIFVNNVPDLNGQNFNPNGVEPWIGNMPQTSFNLGGGALTGTAVEGFEITYSGLAAGMSGQITLVEGPEGSIEMEFDFQDVTGGAQFEFAWHGTNAFPLKNTLNDARFRNVPVNFWWDFGFFGQAEYALFKLDASLWGKGGDGVWRRIASCLTDQGNGGMYESQRAWNHGIDGVLRAGDGGPMGGFYIPSNETYSDAKIAFGILTLPTEFGVPVETAKLRWGRMALRAAKKLATPLPGRFA